MKMAMRRKQIAAEEVKIKVYGREIERVSKFKYLGRRFMEDDNDSRSITVYLNRA